MLTFTEAMAFRHACKQFDPDKKIPDNDFEQILEFGRLSPSSFGMEQWRFVVVKTPERRKQLKAACWGQAQITDSSHVVVILAKTSAVKPNTSYVNKLFQRRNLPDEALKLYLEKYENHHKVEIDPIMSTYAWSARQCYIALANMMTGAAAMGIDSCPIEGFSKAQVEKVLSIDTSEHEVAVLVTFGYRAGEQTARYRQKLDDLVEYC